MKITYDPSKRQKTLEERELDFEDASRVFAGKHIISMRKANEREQAQFAQHLG